MRCQTLRSLQGRFPGASLLFGISLVIICINMLGCQTSAPAGAENPQWKKFSEKRTHTTKIESDQASVVHVNGLDQLVTIRNGSTLPQDFLLAYSPALTLKAVLMMQPVRNSQLHTATILEGSVAINDLVVAASDEERAIYSKKFSP